MCLFDTQLCSSMSSSLQSLLLGGIGVPVWVEPVIDMACDDWSEPVLVAGCRAVCGIMRLEVGVLIAERRRLCGCLCFRLGGRGLLPRSRLALALGDSALLSNAEN